MESRKPIYEISKELGINSNKIIMACKTLGINAKGSTKRLNCDEIENINNYFNSGKNVSSEIIEVVNNKSEQVDKKITIKEETKHFKNIYFPNRLIG